MDKKELAEKIVQELGGKENILQSWHCITRLRFNVADEEKVNLDGLKALGSVMGAQYQNGQFQVIIGNKVAEVYEQVSQVLGSLESSGKNQPVKRKHVIDAVFDIISGIFAPILPAIVGAGLLKGVLSLIIACKLMVPADSGYVVLNMIADAPFYFLPFLVAFSSARKFKTNEFLAVTIAGVIMYPTIIQYAASGEVASLSLLGLKIPMINYSSTVIPIILGVFLMSYIYKAVDRVVPDVLKVIVTPLVVLFTDAVLVLVVVAPLGSYAGVYVQLFFSYLYKIAGPLAGALLGGLMPLIVITGMHYAFFPSTFLNFSKLGYDTILLPLNLVGNMAQTGAALGVAVKTKDSKMKSLAFSTTVSAFFGITEPAIYGVTLKLKKPFYAALAGGAVGGGIYGTFAVKAFSFSVPGITALPSYVEHGTKNFLFAMLGIGCSFAVAFILTLLSNFDNKKSTMEIGSPLAGKIVPLSEVPDRTFAEGIVGQGVGIIPSEGIVKAPFQGIVSAVTDSRHAIGLTSDQGVELLVHIGIDTVSLGGDGFKLLVKEGQTVKKGDILLSFDMEKIKNAGFDLISPVLITNTPVYDAVKSVSTKETVHFSDLILQITPKNEEISKKN
ncbi:MAG: biotin/lipoyl-binding protein [Paenibacillaceae bacterium]|nr:biotin/lipoyl-binding protein [Paenibacillaceae bacterium]